MAEQKDIKYERFLYILRLISPQIAQISTDILYVRYKIRVDPYNLRRALHIISNS